VDEALLEAQAAVLLVECDPPPRGCGAEIGYDCTSTSQNPFNRGKPLGRRVAHYGRLRRAGVTLPGGRDDVDRCPQSALPVAECDHCRRRAELDAARPHRLSLPFVAAYSGTCPHCSQLWPVGAAIVRVVGGHHTHVGCSTEPPDEEHEHAG